MPIYEFRCLQCSACFELLVMSRDETFEMRCPECRSEDFERIMSASRHTVSAGAGEASACSQTGCSQTRTCPGGSCTTYDLPGPVS